MNFEQQVQQWTAIDNQLKRLNEQTKQLREKRAIMSKSITSYAVNHGISSSGIKISDGTLKIVSTRVPEQLTFKYLERSLSKIIKNENQVKQILDHVKANREITIVPEIKRYSND
jgi:hypothetical protein